MTEPKSWSLELPARISGLVNLNCLKNETEVSQCLAVIYPAILLTFERLVNVHRLRAEKILNDSDVQKKIEEWQGRPMNEIVGDKKIAIRRSCHPDDITRIINQQSVTFEGDEVSQALDLPFCEVHKLMRHALAHGNIWAVSGSNSQMKTIVFANCIRKNNAYDILFFDICAFRAFAISIIRELRDIHSEIMDVDVRGLACERIDCCPPAEHD